MKLAGRERTGLVTDGIERPRQGPTARRALGRNGLTSATSSSRPSLGRPSSSSLGGQPRLGPLPVGKVLLHGPAILVVFGGAIALALFMGAGAGARALDTRIRHDRPHRSAHGAHPGPVRLRPRGHRGDLRRRRLHHHRVLRSPCSASWPSPRPSRTARSWTGRRAGAAPSSRMFWILLPLMSFIFLILTFIMVVTPMTKPG
ncbi:MAG: hypothetical protein MZU84_08310 [Sphingobacterium sp.]|nr:hypothetical protein [Sphingobacterium sp.]